MRGLWCGSTCQDGVCVTVDPCTNRCGEFCPACPEGQVCQNSRCITPESGPTSSVPPPVATLGLDLKQLASGTRQLSKDLQSQREQAAMKLLEGICKGLGDATSVILSFTDDLNTQKKNRLKSGCASNPCKGNRDGEACMQFPFASTLNAESGSSWTCVPRLTQYFQGAILSHLRNRSSIQQGQTYKLELSGFSCQTLKPDSLLVNANHAQESTRYTRSQLARRDVPELEPGSTQSGEMESFPPFTSENTLSTVIVGLGDMVAGTYNIQSKLTSGTVEDLRVSDCEGNDYGSVGNVGTTFSSGEYGFNFTIPDDAMSVGYFMGTSDAVVNAASTLQMISAGLNSASTPQSTLVITTSLMILVAILFL